MASLSALYAWAGLVERQSARTVTVWAGSTEAIDNALSMARAIERCFPRTLVVLVRKGSEARAEGIAQVERPGPLFWSLLLRRLRTQTLLLVGVPPQDAGVLARLAHSRGAGLALIEDRNAPIRPVDPNQWDALVEVRLDPARCVAAPEQCAESLRHLVTRSRRRTMLDRSQVPMAVQLVRKWRAGPLRSLFGCKFQQFRSVEALQQALGRPRTILCLGNGPSSESPELEQVPYERLFRVNMSWIGRGVLLDPDLVFTGLADATAALRPRVGFVFGSILSEEKILGSLLLAPRSLAFATAERLALFEYRITDAVAPTNGALMIALAVALRPERLTIAGIDLYSAPVGAYPGDSSTPNEYAVGHEAALDRRYILAALKRFEGELEIIGQPLRDALRDEEN